MDVAPSSSPSPGRSGTEEKSAVEVDDLGEARAAGAWKELAFPTERMAIASGARRLFIMVDIVVN